MLLKGSGYKGAACTSTSAIRNSFLHALSCIKAAFSLKFSFYCQKDFLESPFYLKTLPWATFELTIIHMMWKVLGLRHSFLLEKSSLNRHELVLGSLSLHKVNHKGFSLFFVPVHLPSTWGLGTSFPSQLLCYNICWLKENLLISMGIYVKVNLFYRGQLLWE